MNPTPSESDLKMSKTKNVAQRRGLSVCILTASPINVQHKKRDEKLQMNGWQLVSLPSGPIWIKEEAGQVVMTDEPP